MYDIFDKLCQEKNVTPYKVCKDLHISQGTISNWKNRGNNLSTQTLKLIAEYFDVPVDYLMGSNNLEWNPTTQEIDVSIKNDTGIDIVYKRKLEKLFNVLINDKILGEQLMDYADYLCSKDTKPKASSLNDL